MQFRDLNRQYRAMKAEMDDAMNGVVASGRFILGEQVSDLESRLAAYVGMKHCVTCANGTDALLMSLMVGGVGKGDAVFVPDFTFFATAEVVERVGATPVFVDVCDSSFNMDADDLTEKIDYVENYTDMRPAAVIAVDLFGQPADYGRLKALCRERNLLLVEDGAQGFGGSIGDKKACSFGDICTTSFFPAKPLGCYGDGGAMFTDSDEWTAMMRSLRQHGSGNDKYDNVRIGLNSRLDAIQAAVLNVKLNHFDEELRRVNEVARMYGELLDGRVTTPIVPQGVTSSWAQYTIQCPHRDELQLRLKADGIPSAVYYPRTMSQQTAFAAKGSKQLPCPTALRLTGRVLSLPMHPYLTQQEIESIAKDIL